MAKKTRSSAAKAAEVSSTGAGAEGTAQTYHDGAVPNVPAKGGELPTTTAEGGDGGGDSDTRAPNDDTAEATRLDIARAELVELREQLGKVAVYGDLTKIATAFLAGCGAKGADVGNAADEVAKFRKEWTDAEARVSATWADIRVALSSKVLQETVGVLDSGSTEELKKLHGELVKGKGEWDGHAEADKAFPKLIAEVETAITAAEAKAKDEDEGDDDDGAPEAPPPAVAPGTAAAAPGTPPSQGHTGEHALVGAAAVVAPAKTAAAVAPDEPGNEGGDEPIRTSSSGGGGGSTLAAGTRPAAKKSGIGLKAVAGIIIAIVAVGLAIKYAPEAGPKGTAKDGQSPPSSSSGSNTANPASAGSPLRTPDTAGTVPVALHESVTAELSRLRGELDSVRSEKDGLVKENAALRAKADAHVVLPQPSSSSDAATTEAARLRGTVEARDAEILRLTDKVKAAESARDLAEARLLAASSAGDDSVIVAQLRKELAAAKAELATAKANAGTTTTSAYDPSKEWVDLLEAAKAAGRPTSDLKVRHGYAFAHTWSWGNIKLPRLGWSKEGLSSLSDHPPVVWAGGSALSFYDWDRVLPMEGPEWEAMSLQERKLRWAEFVVWVLPDLQNSPAPKTGRR